MTPYRVAIIGTGRMSGPIEDDDPGVERLAATNRDFVLPYGHVQSYAAVEETEVVAAADIDRDRVEAWCARYGVPNAYVDVDELLERERPDIVSITTGAQGRAEIIAKAAAAGVRGIWAEKALCTSTDEAAAIRRVCEQHSVQLQYGPIRRFWSGYERGRGVIASGEIGEPIGLVAYGGWRLFYELTHSIDDALYLLGDPPAHAVSALLRDTQVTRDDEGVYHLERDSEVISACFELERGVRVVFGPFYPGDVEVAGTKGFVRCHEDSRSWTVSMRHGDGLRTRELDYTGTSAGVAKVRDLLHAVKTGEPGRSNLAVTLRGMEIAFAAVVSHARGGARVELPLAESVVAGEGRLTPLP